MHPGLPPNPAPARAGLPWPGSLFPPPPAPAPSRPHRPGVRQGSWLATLAVASRAFTTGAVLVLLWHLGTVPAAPSSTGADPGEPAGPAARARWADYLSARIPGGPGAAAGRDDPARAVRERILLDIKGR